MSRDYSVDFCTFCYSGDGHRLHKPGHLQRMVDSNNCQFNEIFIIHQKCNPADFDNPYFCDFQGPKVHIVVIDDIDSVLKTFGIDLGGQYISDTDLHHNWQVHVVNHLAAVQRSDSRFIVFADNDCWMVEQPAGKSWIDRGIELLMRADCFIVSPNDGEPERRTKRMSQQMFLAHTESFRYANLNQPGWDGNVNIPGGPMPEYWGMLEGRMELYCQMTGQYRYVLGPEYRYWHHNRLNELDYFETDRSKY